MAASTTAPANPFADPEPLSNICLSVGRSASLTLGTDALVVLDEAFAGQQKSISNCFGLLSGNDKTTRSMQYYNILWAELRDHDITVTYADNISKKSVRPNSLNYTIEPDIRAKAEAWIEQLLSRAYGRAQRRKRIKVYINPFGGQGSAQKLYTRQIEPILAAARCELDVEKTQYAGHAVELAQNLDISQWDVIACCSGDGIPHEVFNGLSKRPDASSALAKIAVVQLPCGSGNAMSINLNGTAHPSLASVAIVKGLRAPMDLVSVTQDDKRYISFLSQAAGIVAEADLGTENMRWLGSARFDIGFLMRVLTGKVYYPADIAVAIENDSKPSIQENFRQEAAKPPGSWERPEVPPNTPLPALRYGTVSDPLPEGWNLIPHDIISTFYCGNMKYMAPSAPFFPYSLPTDGCMDCLTVPGNVGKLEAITSTFDIEKETFLNRPYVGYSKITGYRFIPRRIPHRKDTGEKIDGYIAVDGEKIPFRGFQAEVHRGLGTVLCRSGHLFEKEQK